MYRHQDLVNLALARVYSSEECQQVAQKVNPPSFSAEVFTLLLELGAHDFCKFSGSFNLKYRRGNEARPTWVRMSLASNEMDFNRLKIYYLSDSTVDMKFYTVEKLANGKVLKTNHQVWEKVELGYMLQIFEEATGLNMGRRSESDGGDSYDADFDTPAPDDDDEF